MAATLAIESLLLGGIAASLFIIVSQSSFPHSKAHEMLLAGAN